MYQKTSRFVSGAFLVPNLNPSDYHIRMALSDHSASASSAGYHFQFERALWHLATGGGIQTVGIETLDDLATLDNKGNWKLEQDKRTGDDNKRIIGLGSEQLWKTLHIWVQQVVEGGLSAETTSFLLVTNSKNIPVELKRLSETSNQDELKQLVLSLSEKVANCSKNVKPHADYVLDEQHEGVLLNVLKNTEVHYNVCREKMYEQIEASLLLSDDILDYSGKIIDALLGWITKTVMDKWQRKEEGWISKQSYNNRYQSLVSDYRHERRIFRSANAVSISLDDRSKEEGSNYVKQLYIIGAQSLVPRAIEDKLREQLERIYVNEQGYAVESDWESLEHDLLKHWEDTKNEVILDCEDDVNQCKIGRRIYAQTMNCSATFCDAPILHDYVTKGEFHRLADEIKLGWHPEYESELKKHK